jgi:hypothetical protein
MIDEPARAAVIQEDRPRFPFTDVEIERSRWSRRQRNRDGLIPLSMDEQRAVPSVDVEVVDLGAKGLGNPQSVQRQQACERVVPTAAESGWTRNAPSSLRSSPRVEDS